MPDIRYMCVSDLHLGADNSLLTHLGSEIGDVTPLRPRRVLVGLVNCPRELVRHNKANVKPTLILNGDLLELAVAQDNIALMAFERFIELLFLTSDEHLVDPRIIFNSTGYSERRQHTIFCPRSETLSLKLSSPCL